MTQKLQPEETNRQTDPTEIITYLQTWMAMTQTVFSQRFNAENFHNGSNNWVFHDKRFCQIIWQIFTQGRAKKNSSKNAPSGDWNQDLRIFRPMPYQLS